MDIRELIRPLEAHFLRTNWVQKGVWVPVFTGFSADPTGVIARYVLTGNLCKLFVFMTGNGTSSDVVFNVTAPFVSANIAGMAWGGLWWTAVDNNVALTAPGRVYINANTNLITLQKDTVNGPWTNTGGKRAHFGLEYEIG